MATGATAGHLLACPLAAALVGHLAERRNDRTLLESIPAMLAGSAIIYLLGVTWIAHDLHVGAIEAVELGLTPFLIGDAVKALAAEVLLPTTVIWMDGMNWTRTCTSGRCSALSGRHPANS